MDGKIKFFGQYFGQVVAKERNAPDSPPINVTKVLFLNRVNNYHLELKDPSKVSNEDLALFAKNDNVAGIDFLRSRGYAQQFMQYSIDDLVKLGWVKLI